MSRRPAKTKFEPLNPQKYFGKTPIIARSGWEYQAMMLFDRHPSIIRWSSESVQIPYRNPLTGKMTVYIPDFVLIYEDKQRKQRAEMIEIKPARESPLHETGGRMTQARKLTQIINAAKWQAAAAYCARHGLSFRVLTESEMFGKTKRTIGA